MSRPDWTALEWFAHHEPDAIIMWHGRMRLAFPAGTSQAAIDKRLKAIDKASKESPTPKRPSLPKPTRVKVPSLDMMKAARYGEVVMPPDMLKAGLLAMAHRTLKKWPDENPPEYAKWMQRKEGGAILAMSTERLERVVGSILKPTGSVQTGPYAASLVWGLEELERREKAADEAWGAA
jgi:hypothetical protein